MNSLLSVRNDLVNMLPEYDRRYPKHVRQAGKGYIPVPIAGEHVVTAADHQRSPNDEDRKLAQCPTFERPRVEQHKERPETKQEPGGGAEACIPDQVEAEDQ